MNSHALTLLTPFLLPGFRFAEPGTPSRKRARGSTIPGVIIKDNKGLLKLCSERPPLFSSVGVPGLAKQERGDSRGSMG